MLLWDKRIAEITRVRVARPAERECAGILRGRGARRRGQDEDVGDAEAARREADKEPPHPAHDTPEPAPDEGEPSLPGLPFAEPAPKKRGRK